MPPKKQNPLDKNVSPNWKPIPGLADRKSGMLWSDRIRHALISLGGLAIIAAGVGIMALIHKGRWGGWLVGVGFAVFVLGFPNNAQKNGYRE